MNGFETEEFSFYWFVNSNIIYQKAVNYATVDLAFSLDLACSYMEWLTLL